MTNTPFAMGGVERVLTVLTNELCKEHQVTIVCTNRGNPDQGYGLSETIQIEYIEDLKVKKTSYFFRRCLRKINSLVKINHYDVLQWSYLPEKENRKYLKSLKGKYDCIIGVQDCYALQLAKIAPQLESICIGWFHNTCSAYFNTYKKYSWHKEALFQELLKNLENNVCLTDKDCKEFSHITASKFIRIYNPVTISNVTNDDINSGKDIDILFVGRIEKEQKGTDFLLDVISQVCRYRCDVRCVVVGDGSDFEQLKNEVIIRGLSENVKLTGAQNNVEDYYARAKILVNTSRWEGFGLVITEAMSYAVPVVSFKTNGPAEIIEDGRSGYLIECYDIETFSKKVSRLLDDEQLRLKLSAGAKKRAEDFSRSTIVNEWNILLKNIERRRK